MDEPIPTIDELGRQHTTSLLLRAERIGLDVDPAWGKAHLVYAIHKRLIELAAPPPPPPEPSPLTVAMEDGQRKHIEAPLRAREAFLERARSYSLK